MENRLVLLDSSVLIDYFRKVNKEQSIFYKLRKQNYIFFISVVTYFEIEIGKTQNQNKFLDEIFQEIKVIPFNREEAKTAKNIYQKLKSLNKIIETKDLFIAATAIANQLPIATLNLKHFERIEDLEILSIE